MVHLRQYTVYLFLSLLFSFKAYATEPSDPMVAISYATDNVIKALVDTPVEERSPQMVRALVENYLLPVIDEEKIAMGALGKHWKRASPEERAEFIEIFRERQIKTYTGAFQNFDNQQMHFSETRFDPKGEKAIVKGEFIIPNAENVPLHFRLYRNKGTGEWLVYDALVLGQSVIRTYRAQFNNQLKNKTLADLVVELKSGEASTELQIADEKK